MWDLSSLTIDGTCTRCSESMESSPLDHQGSPEAYPFNVCLFFFFLKIQLALCIVLSLVLFNLIHSCFL